jgi:hypothetical protein
VAGAAAAAVVAARTSGEREVDTVEIRETGGREGGGRDPQRSETEGGVH